VRATAAAIVRVPEGSVATSAAPCR
jgi:hypothetical protein